MPELPEVETVRRGIEPQVRGRQIDRVTVRERRLRWPIASDLETTLAGQTIHDVGRRSKYLLLRLDRGHLMVHLGMSGRLGVVDAINSPKKHDHVDICIDNGRILRFNDARRFGSMLWIERDDDGHADASQDRTATPRHPLLEHLGPEPLSDDFSPGLLYRHSRKRQVAIKNFIMDSRIVVGVGNIYASESLFRAGIHPARPAGRVSAARYEQLQHSIRNVLADAIRAGGTTLRDFANADGMPGYFKIDLDVYGREGQPCHHCAAAIRRIVLGQRSTFYCPKCQR